MRRIWIVLIVCIVVLVGLFVYVRTAFPPDKLRALVEPRLEAALGRPVELGNVHLTLFRPAVRLDDVRVLDPAIPESTLASVTSLELRPSLGALLHRALTIHSIRVVDPVIHLHQHADGSWNWATPPRAASHGPTAAPQPAAALDLRIESLQIASGRVLVSSEPLHVDLEVPLVADVSLGADRALRAVTLSGWIAADSIRGGERGLLRGLPPLRLRLEPRVRIDVPDSSAVIENLRVAINDAVVDVTGSARQQGGHPVVHLETRSDAIDLAALLAALPPGTAGARGLTAAGTVRLDVRIDARPPALPIAHGQVELRDGVLQMAGLPQRVDNLTANLEMAGDSLRVHEIAARIGTAPVRVEGLVLEPLAALRSRYDLHVTAAIDLAQVAKVAPLPEGTSLAGHADIDVRVRGRTARPDSVWVDGPVTLRDLDARTPLLLQPVRGNARLVGTGEQVRIESAQFRAGTSDLALTGTLVPALPPRRPRAVVEGRSKKLDLAALLPTTAASVAREPATNPGGAPERSLPPLLPVLPPLDVRGTLRADEVVLTTGTMRDARLDLDGGPAGLVVRMDAAEIQADRAVLRDVNGTLRIADQAGQGSLRAASARLQRIEATGLEGDLAIAGRQVKLDNLRGTAYDGALRGHAFVDFADPAVPAYDLDLNGDKIDANVFLGSLTPLLRNVITGTVDLRSAWDYAGTGPKAILTSLTGKGQAAAIQGRIQEIPALHNLSNWFGLPSLKSLPYDDLGMHFDVDSGRMRVQDLAMKGKDANLDVTGSIGLDGSLDLGLHVALSEALSKRYLGAQPQQVLSTLFADPTGRLVFDFALGGSYRAPKLQPDLQKTAKQAGVRALTGDLVQKLLGGAGVSLPGGIGAPPGAAPGSTSGGATPAEPPAQALEEAGRRAVDEARQRAADDARAKLNDKLGGLFKKPPRADTSQARPDSTRR